MWCSVWGGEAARLGPYGRYVANVTVMGVPAGHRYPYLTLSRSLSNREQGSTLELGPLCVPTQTRSQRSRTAAQADMIQLASGQGW